MIPGASHGKWEFTLPTENTYPVHRASLTVSYLDETVEFYYQSVRSIEVGRMGHYEDSDFSMVSSSSDAFYGSREALLAALMAFVPRSDRNSGLSPMDFHAISKRALPDDALEELLSRCFL